VLELLGVDDHLVDAVLGGGLGLGDHDRDRLAREDDLLACERLAGAAALSGGDRQIGGGQHGDHARHRLGRLGVDRPDARVRVPGQHQAGVQQAGHGDVGREAGGAAQLRLGVDAAPAYADRVSGGRSYCHPRHATEPG
jgi:hypothetical protein